MPEVVDNVADLFETAVSPKAQVESQQVVDLLSLGGNDLTGLPVRNITCIKRHCSSEVAACLGDQTCRENFQCSGQCDPANSTCTFMCTESYKCETQDRLMSCMF